MKRRRLKLKPHYFWLGGIFVIGGLITSLIISRPDTSETHAAEKTIADISTMQEMTPEICAKMSVTPTSSTAPDIKLTDTRDGSTYSIAKFADGNCWMTQNLRIIDKTISGDDSDLPSGSVFTIPASNISGFTSSDQYEKKAYYNNTTYGAYYNWYTATAGTDTSIVSSDGTSVRTSICPKGWKLPTGGSSGQFQVLANVKGVGTSLSTWIGSPYIFQYSGLVDSGSLNYVGSSGNGYYWSRTVKSSGNAYGLNIFSGVSSINPVSNNARYFGFAVRCVAATSPLDEVYTMQGLTADVCTRAKIGDTASLMDERDGKYYSIAKIKNATNDDANCWMTSNLALDLETAWNAEIMTPALTDVPSDSYFSDIGSATPKNTGFSVSSSNYQSIEYTNTSPTVASGTYQSSYGYYYTWCAATVGCKRGTTAGASLTSGDADASICPAGWKLPSGNTNGDWYNLLKDLNMSTIVTSPYNIPAAGNMNSYGLGGAASDGYYWSRTASAADNAYLLYFVSGNFYPGTNAFSRYFGHSVRCVADPTYTGSSSGNQKDSGQANFSVVVDDAITLVGAEFYNNEGGNTIHGIPGSVAEGKISVEVGSNVNYKITMRADEPDLTASKLDNASVIPTISNTVSGTPVTSTLAGLRDLSGWAVKPTSSDLYLGLLATDQTFYTSTTTAGASTITDFPVGVGLSPTLLPDTYSTTVTITAIANP